MKSLFVRFVREDAGQDLIEYGLLVAIISIVAMGGSSTPSAEMCSTSTQTCRRIPPPQPPRTREMKDRLTDSFVRKRARTSSICVACGIHLGCRDNRT